MPSRMIREGLLDSEKIRRAGELAEVLFMRLMLVADDYGRFDGRVSVICRRCWPVSGPTDEDVLARLVALTEEGLVTTYEVDGKPFICIPNFKQRLRVKNPSKYPDPPNAGQMPDTRPTADSEVRLEARSEKREVEARSEKRNAREEPPPKPGEAAVPAPTARAAVAEQEPQPLSLQEAKAQAPPGDPRGILAAICTANGVKATPFNPVLYEWAERGITAERLKSAIATARLRKPAPENIPLKYLEPILLEEPKTQVGGGWATDERACQEKAKELGLWPCRKGEGWPELRARIREKLHEHSRAQVQ